ncbi:hypothetical protein L3X38_036114 [Prunus dulcis]|uniref:Retrotransposon gag domain-containing protein n=1 Tax=Prunus dulcis TaxID=3755 RepID=A0AAD4V2K8_PRUDU|nr:hypothetical protein L3X38_036114 [Prunus dulcis]
MVRSQKREHNNPTFSIQASQWLGGGTPTQSKRRGILEEIKSLKSLDVVQNQRQVWLVVPNEVPARGPQVEVQPNILGANPPQPNAPAGGNPAPDINVPPIGNNPYVVANQFQGFLPYNQFRPQVHPEAGVNFVGPHINQYARIGGWNNLGGNANLNNPLLGNQAIDRWEIEQMIQDMVPYARRIGRPFYRRPYPDHFDQDEFPLGFKVPDFALFSGDGFQSTVEHIGRFTAQCAEIGHCEALKLRLLPSTLMGTTFSWYVKLSQNSVPNWQIMEQIFHEQFYQLEPEVSMADLAKMRQGSNEPVQEYLEKLREERARFKVNMLEHEFVKLAQGGLFFDLRKKFESIEFHDIYDILLRVDRYEPFLKKEQQKNRPTSRSTFYRDPPKPSTSRTMAVHAVDIDDLDSEGRNEEVFQEKEEELAGINLAEIVASGPHDLIDRKVLKFPEKSTMDVDQNPFPNAPANMVNVNFRRPDQPRPRLDLGCSGKVEAERRARETQADPKAKGKAKMYPEMTKALNEKIPIREEPPKAIVLCNRCQCEVSLEVVPPKAKEPSREQTTESAKEQVQTVRPKSAGMNMIKSPAKNYGPHSPRDMTEIRPNKRLLHEYQDKYERPRY